jgi:rhodanese-related sulfurtransferase
MHPHTHDHPAPRIWYPLFAVLICCILLTGCLDVFQGENVFPVPIIFSEDLQDTPAALTIRFSGNQSYANQGELVNYTWIFYDVNQSIMDTQYEMNVTHDFFPSTLMSLVDIYLVELRVVDSEGRKNSTFLEISVSKGFENITVDEVQTLLNTSDVHVFDVRSSDVYANGSIGSALSFPLDMLDDICPCELTEYTNTIIVYSEEGVDSFYAAQLLVEYGKTPVYNMDAGIAGWRAAGYPVVEPSS